jgi:signal transduction histidine kinase
MKKPDLWINRPGKTRVMKNNFPDGTEVFADPLIVKVLFNLIDNAVRYGGKITTIRFSVEEREGDHHFVVCEDDGEGVLAGEKERIFDRGFRKNIGLGLAISREILSITGLTIQETGRAGAGSRFEIGVPAGCFRLPETFVNGNKKANGNINYTPSGEVSL